MKPLQVYLDEGELGRLDALAKSYGWTKSEAVRVAIRALTRPLAPDSILKLSGMVRGLPAGLASEVSRYLGETFDAKTPRSKSHRSRRPRVRRHQRVDRTGQRS
ncbi:MAG TPA: CopG family transcriptional regulator [Polyangiaceae bacterium]|nr:CopG family transcriptional regulator [Polyangiaceae bacterium]